MYMEETIILKETCTTKFTEVLFTTAKTRKPPKFPPTVEQIRRCSTYGYYSAIKIMK